MQMFDNDSLAHAFPCSVFALSSMEHIVNP